MTLIVLILLIAAAVQLFLAAVGTVSPRWNLGWGGLLFWVVAVIVVGVQAGIH